MLSGSKKNPDVKGGPPPTIPKIKRALRSMTEKKLKVPDAVPPTNFSGSL